uniref:Uncharacterized protein n=1 Tax=Romanomermis culicivorax TaxID=13658 RepID=A0A915JG56_ROMCU
MVILCKTLLSFYSSYNLTHSFSAIVAPVAVPVMPAMIVPQPQIIYQEQPQQYGNNYGYGDGNQKMA